jgi:intracellular multiplication protein IcmQ
MSSGFSLGTQSQVKNSDLKGKLLERLKAESQHLSELAREFYENNAAYSNSDYIQLCKEIVSGVDKVFMQENWDESLFLHNSLKPLKDLQTQALLILEQLEQSSSISLPEKNILTEECELLYISLYQQDGLDMKKWELQLKSIECYLAGRPIYQLEEEVKKVIRLKVAQTSEAYVSVAVKKSAIQNKAQFKRLDRCGHPLVNISAGAVTANDIVEFVHQNQRYYFANGKLISENSGKLTLK